MRIIVEIRERKNRPNLNEVLKVYRKRKEEDGADPYTVKASFQEKFIKLYSEKEDVDEEQKDEKYKLLIETMTRIKQPLGSQQVALSALVGHVNNLIERKNKRIAKREGKQPLMDGTYQTGFSGTSKFSKGANKGRRNAKQNSSS